MTQINMEMFLKGMLCTLEDPFGRKSNYYMKIYFILISPVMMNGMTMMPRWSAE